MIEINGKEVYGIVYKITNKINGKSYIGITTDKRGFNGRYYHRGKGIERVYKYHKTQKENGKYYNSYLLRSIEKYGLDSFEVCEVFDTAMSREELSNKEIYYIELFNSFHNGYNMTLGGETGCGAYQPKGKDNPLSVAVCQLTLDGKLVKIWDSLADIRRDSEYNVPNIEWTCRGINSQSYGYLWVFKKDYDENKEYRWKPSNNYKSVVLLDDDDNIIKEYISIKNACDDLNLDRKTVRDTCNNVWKNPKYKLKFKKDYEYLEEQRLTRKGLY